MIKMDFKKVSEIITNQKKGRRILSLVFGAFLLGLTYNVLLTPNKLMTGGISGLAIIVGEISNFSPQIFIYIMSLLLLLIGLITLGIKETKGAVIGSILYPIMVSLTTPLSEYLLPHLNFDHILIPVLLSGLILGFANGIIYRAGYNTGGSDILMKILSKFGKMPEGKASLIVSVILLAIGACALGINLIIYSCIVIFITSNLIDKIMIGISDTKMFLIQSEYYRDVREYIMKELKTGVTELEVVGGYTKEKAKLLLVVVRSQDYYIFKESILTIDPNAFFIINDCYEVKGGVKRKNNSIFQID